MLVLVIPIAGYIFYLLFGSLRMSKNRKKLIKALDNELINEASKYKDEIKLEDANLEKLATYINNTTGLQVQRNTMSKFLPSGEDFHKELLAELKKQKSFFWNTSLFVKGHVGKYKRSVNSKVQEGRCSPIYDFGSINKVSYKFKKELESAGIKVVNFNPYRPRLTMIINYRDHRKITIIDGNVGFVGGANLADEYINRKKVWLLERCNSCN